MKRIVCFHLYNDFSGSPRSLSTVLKGLLDEGYTVDLVTSSTEGALDVLQSDRLNIYRYTYRFDANLLLTGINYLWVQLYTFLLALRYLFNRNVVFYVNTLLPVAPALAGRITGKKVVWHYREHAPAKGRVYGLLCKIMQITASDILCVSAFQSTFLSRKANVHVVSNSLPLNLASRLESIHTGRTKNILMPASLKRYKGVAEFIKLAGQLPQYTFNLVLNDSMPNIGDFIKKNTLEPTENIKIVGMQKNVVPFYQTASLVINLSNKDFFVETFGMTVLEAMTAGLPVIVPTVGGVAELVEDGVNGYKIDVQHLDRIAECIDRILSDDELYRKLSAHARQKAQEYSLDRMMEKIITVIEN